MQGRREGEVKDSVECLLSVQKGRGEVRRRGDKGWEGL